ncbi:MAG: hypothetical protein U1F19_02090 [Lysobacterales bacterium]
MFGKNTSAGVINVVTRKPDPRFAADAEVTFGNYVALGLAGGVNVPLVFTRRCACMWRIVTVTVG